MSLVYSLAYAVLAFAEVLVLFGSILGLLALAGAAVIRALCNLKNDRKKPAPQCALSFVSRSKPCWLECRGRIEPPAGLVSPSAVGRRRWNTLRS
jgi:hypothetical protein